MSAARIALHMHIGDVRAVAAPHHAVGAEFLDDAAGEGQQAFIIGLVGRHIAQPRQLHIDVGIFGQVQHIGIFPGHAGLGIGQVVDQHLAAGKGRDGLAHLHRIVGADIQLHHQVQIHRLLPQRPHARHRRRW